MAGREHGGAPDRTCVCPLAGSLSRGESVAGPSLAGLPRPQVADFDSPRREEPGPCARSTCSGDRGCASERLYKGGRAAKHREHPGWVGKMASPSPWGRPQDGRDTRPPTFDANGHDGTFQDVTDMELGPSASQREANMPVATSMRGNPLYDQDAPDLYASNASGRASRATKTGAPGLGWKVWAIIVLLLLVILGLAIGLGVEANKDRSAGTGFDRGTKTVKVAQASVGSLDGYESAGSLFEGAGSWSLLRGTLPSDVLVSDAVALAIGGDRVLFPGGKRVISVANSTAGASADTHIWDAVTGLWTDTTDSGAPLASMPEPRMRYAAALFDGKVYVIGGYDATETQKDTTYVYDIAANTWTAGPPLSLGTRGDSCAAVVRGRLYVVGGFDASFTPLASVERLSEDGERWERVADMPTPRGDLQCAEAGGELVAVGGWNDVTLEDFTPDSFVTATESFDGSRWQVRAPMRYARGDHALVRVPGDRLVALGGETHFEGRRTEVSLHAVEEYDFASDSWIQLAPMTQSRFRALAAYADGAVHVFGGHQTCESSFDPPFLSSCPSTAVEGIHSLFLPAHPNVFVYVSRSPETAEDEANDMAAGIVSDDVRLSLLPAAVVPERAPYEHVGFLQAGSGYWVTKNPAPSGRSGHSTHLHDGAVHVLGGTDVAGGVATGGLKYTVGLDRWTADGAGLPAGAARTWHASAQIGSKVFLVGGFSALSTDARLHTPATETVVVDLAAAGSAGNVSATQTAPAARAGWSTHGCAAATGGVVFYAGGFTIDSDASNARGFPVLVPEAHVDEFDPAGGVWLRLTQGLSVPRGACAAAAVGGLVYVAGGLVTAEGLQGQGIDSYDPASFLKTVDVLDPATGRWTSAASMRRGRAGFHLAVLPSGNLLAVGGASHWGAARTRVSLLSVEEFEVARNEWVERAPLPAARFGFAAVLTGAGVLAVGGTPACGPWLSTGTCPATASPTVDAFQEAEAEDLSVLVSNTLPRYDLTEDLILLEYPTSPVNYELLSSVFVGRGYWAHWSEPALARSDHVAAPVSDTEILIAGGVSAAGTVIGTAVIYDVTLRQVAPVPDMPTPRARAAVAAVGSHVFVFGGVEADGVTPRIDVDVFDVNTRTWFTRQAKVPPGFRPLVDACAAAVPGTADILIAGGHVRVGGVWTAQADVYRVSVSRAVEATFTAGFERLPSMPTARGDAACGVVGDRFHVIGGATRPGNATASAGVTGEIVDANEAYNPATDQWSVQAPLPTPRADSAAAATSGHRLVVAGGEETLGTRRAKAAHDVLEYHHEADAWTPKASLPFAVYRGQAAALQGVVHVVGGRASCATAASADCPERASQQVQALHDVDHPEVFIHRRVAVN
ncbi:unnamed protein product [Pedinophyceae sp. YPF-701]|nr:unnamed protein product [Pedinophyceae sp. YPF-701]